MKFRHSRMVAHTRRISPGSGLNVDTAMPCARPVRPAWSEPSPQAPQSTSSPWLSQRAERGVERAEALVALVVRLRPRRVRLDAAGHAHTFGDGFVRVGEASRANAGEQCRAVRRAFVDRSSLEREPEHRGDDLRPQLAARPAAGDAPDARGEAE